MDRKQLKALAKQQYKGHVGVLFLITVVVIVMSLMVATIPKVGVAMALCVVLPVFNMGIITVYLNLMNCMTPEVAELFVQFKNIWPVFKVTVLRFGLTFLWSLLLVIPGIIKAYSYSMSMYILAEDPKIGALEAIQRSKAMMDGHKMEFFMLHLSFVGWYLLCAVTFGIAAVWVVPYVSATNANFYNSIKNTVRAE